MERNVKGQIQEVSQGGRIAQNNLEKHYSVDHQGGFDPDKVQDTISHLDSWVRDEFGVTEPIHLWDGYASGDANDERLKEETGYDDLDKLFNDMGHRLIVLVEETIEKERPELLKKAKAKLEENGFEAFIEDDELKVKVEDQDEADETADNFCYYLDYEGYFDNVVIFK